MRRTLIALFLTALAGKLAAQEPTTHAPERSIITTGLTHVVGGACHDACPANTCISQPTTKKTSKTVFSSKCIEFCLPKCSCCSLFSGGCDDCGENCGHVRTKHVLLKKVVTEECPSTECVVAPACVPACTTGAPVVGPADKVAAPLPKGGKK